MSALEKWSIWTTSVLTGVTGIGYLWTKYFVEASDPFAVVNHPLQPWFLKAHIIVSPFLLLALGMILFGHVWKHYTGRITWGRRSGILSILSFLPMVVTGYLIQSVTGQGWLEALAIAHIVAGFLFLLGLGAHQVAIHFLRPPPDRRRLYPLDRSRRRVGRPDASATRSAPKDRAKKDGTGRNPPSKDRPSEDATVKERATKGEGSRGGRRSRPVTTPVDEARG